MRNNGLDIILLVSGVDVKLLKLECDNLVEDLYKGEKE